MRKRFLFVILLTYPAALRQSGGFFTGLPFDKAHSSRLDLPTYLFAAFIVVGYLPTTWKHANCVVIPKGRKRGPHAPKSYRPMSLLSNVSKVFEKLIHSKTGGHRCRCNSQHTVRGYRESLGDRRPFTMV